MRPRRLPIGLVLPAALVLLVALLATLQYKWLGQVSEAERERLSASMHQSAEELAADFDRELTDAYRYLQVDATSLQSGNWAAFAVRYDSWRERAKDPRIVKAIYLANGTESNPEYFEYHPDTRTFERAAWPAALAPIKVSLAVKRESAEFTSTGASSPSGALRAFETAKGVASQTLLNAFRQPVFPDIPALVITMSTVQSTQSGAPSAGIYMSPFPLSLSMRLNTSAIVLELDRDYIQSTLLPSLVTRYFPRSEDQLRFEVVENSTAQKAVFTRGLSANAKIDAVHADASVPLFTLRPDLGSNLLFRAATTETPSKTRDATITVETHSIGDEPQIRVAPVGKPPAQSAEVMTAEGVRSNFSIIAVGGPGGRSAAGTNLTTLSSGAWQLMVQHSAGSLDAAVGRARLRNLWLSFGILGVLAAGVALIVVNAERSRKLAVQQMDFVATVSHELRTPLTVIRSAAQNLSAGVVSDPAQAKRYGDLIETEGRRLTDMVEQVLEFAGLSGNRKLVHAQPVDVGALTRDVVTSSSALFEAERVEVQLRIAEDLPPVLADEGAIRRAFNNLLANALKYGADGRWIGITARRGGLQGTSSDEVQISVSDRGRGIEADDLPHIFEAFYRGRYAVDRQIHGNGLGLSLVKRIAEAHGGKVTVSSVPGEGATFTIHLPAAAPDPSAVQPQTDPIAASGAPTA